MEQYGFNNAYPQRRFTLHRPLENPWALPFEDAALSECLNTDISITHIQRAEVPPRFSLTDLKAG